jgi:hypothetical protein
MKKSAVDFSRLIAIAPYFKDSTLTDPYMLASTLFLDSVKIAHAASHTALHTDNRPFLEFYTPESILKENWNANLEMLRKNRTNPEEYFTDVPDSQLLTNYMTGQQFLLDGLERKYSSYQTQDDFASVLELYKKALAVNPECREIKMVYESELKVQAR